MTDIAVACDCEPSRTGVADGSWEVCSPGRASVLGSPPTKACPPIAPCGIDGSDWCAHPETDPSPPEEEEERRGNDGGSARSLGLLAPRPTTGGRSGTRGISRVNDTGRSLSHDLCFPGILTVRVDRDQLNLYDGLLTRSIAGWRGGEPAEGARASPRGAAGAGGTKCLEAGSSISLSSPNIYLCHSTPSNNGLFWLIIAILVC